MAHESDQIPPEMTEGMLSLIIVTHNNAEDILPCLDSIPWNRPPLEVLVIDNRSNDGTPDRIGSFISNHPQSPLKLFKNSTNIGYARAVNQGLHRCQGEFICLLGPDTRLHPSAIETMEQTLQTRGDLGLVAPRHLAPDGRIRPSCRRFPTPPDLLMELTTLPTLFPQRFSSKWKMDDFDHATSREVDQPEATCLMTRREAWQDVGDMDERFTMFFNDVDWCYRYKQAGWKILFVAEAQIEHKKGGSVHKRRCEMIWKSHQGFYRYFMKHSNSMMARFGIFGLGALLILTAAYRCVPRLLKDPAT